MADDNLFKKFVHLRSGEEFDMGFLRESKYVETLGLDGPKLIMTWDDPNRYIRDELKIQAQDEVEAYLSDDWALDGMNLKQKFTVMVDPSADRFLKSNLMASPVFKLKALSDKNPHFQAKGCGGNNRGRLRRVQGGRRKVSRGGRLSLYRGRAHERHAPSNRRRTGRAYLVRARGVARQNPCLSHGRRASL